MTNPTTRGSGPSLIINFPDGKIHAFDYSGKLPDMGDKSINSMNLTNLTTDEFIFLTSPSHYRHINEPEYSNIMDNYNPSTYDIIDICNSLRAKGWESPEKYRICLHKAGLTWSYDIQEGFTVPIPPYKKPETDTFIINNREYSLPKAIICEMKTVNDMYTSIGKKEITVPDCYIPYIDGVMKLLRQEMNKYNLGELSLLDFLGFPFEYITQNFFVLDTIIIGNPKVYYNYGPTLLEYGYTLDYCNDKKYFSIEHDTLGVLVDETFFDEDSICPIDIITPNVVELIMSWHSAQQPIRVNGVIGLYNIMITDKKNDAEDLVFLKYLAQKCGYSLQKS